MVNVVMKGISVKTIRLSLLAATAFFTAPLYAQNITQPESDDVFLQEETDDIVVTALGVEQPKSDSGVSISVLNGDDLERRRNVAIADQLRMLPGIAISRNGPIGGFAGVRIRGAEAEQTLVLIDGIAVNDPSSPSGGYDFGTLLGNNVSSIEVLRGANSTVWGNQAIGGVVSIETLSADEHGRNISATGEYGSHDSKRLSAGVADMLGNISFAFGGGYFDTDGISAASAGTEADGMRQYLSHGRIDAELSEALTLELRGYYSHSRVDLDGYSYTTNRVDDLPTYSEAQQANGYAGAKVSLAGGDFVSRIGYAMADINRDNYDPTATTKLTFLARGRNEVLSYRGDYTIGGGHRLLFGAAHEVNRLRTDDNWSDPSTAQNNIDGFYGQWLFAPNDKLNVVAGVRHDDHSRFGGHTSLAGNISYRVTPGLRLRSSYSEGFKAPTLFQLDASANGYGNPALKPEKARSIDAGVEAELIDRTLMVAASAFTRTTRDQIDYINCPTDGSGPAICVGGKRPYGTYDNITKTRAKGFEIELKAQPIPQLNVTANMSYIDARNITDGAANDGKRLARRPVHTGFVAVDYVGQSGWSIGGDLYIAGDSFDDAANDKRLDGYALIGLRAAVPIAGQFELFGRIENATDAAYVTSAGYNSMGRAFYGGVKANF